MSDGIYDALRRVDDLESDSPEREQLWIALWAQITTKTCTGVTPMNSTAHVWVTNDYASLELIAAWEWLISHERAAREMEPATLARTLRGVATKSHGGSARAAMADAFGGISNVPAGVCIRLRSRDAYPPGVAS